MQLLKLCYPNIPAWQRAAAVFSVAGGRAAAAADGGGEGGGRDAVARHRVTTRR